MAERGEKGEYSVGFLGFDKVAGRDGALILRVRDIGLNGGWLGSDGIKQALETLSIVAAILRVLMISKDRGWSWRSEISDIVTVNL